MAVVEEIDLLESSKYKYMKTTTTILKSFALSILISFGVSAQTYNLVWQDEFDLGYLSSDWVIETGIGPGGDGWGNGELQYYRAENVKVANGRLAITAKLEGYGGKSYTSGRIKTQGRRSWKYGKIEARLSMPKFQGIWPAFWTLGESISSNAWPNCGEIDIVEHINTGDEIFGTVHWSDANGNYATYHQTKVVPTSITDFHNYSVEWSPSVIKWFVDGVQFNEVNIANSVNGTHEFHANHFLLLNLAVGGRFPGNAVDNAAFPRSLIVEYVKVYQASSTSTTYSQTYEAENFLYSAGVIVENCNEGGQNLGSFGVGDWASYQLNIPAAGTYKVSYRVSSIYSGKSLMMQKDNGATTLGTIGIPNTGNWQTFTTVSHNIYLPAGSYPVALATSTGGFNINRFHITNNLAARLAPEELTVEPVTSGSMIYPNPVKGKLNFNKSFNNGASIQILDFNGNLLKKTTLANGEKELDMEGLAAGGYILKITSEGSTKVEKIYKE